MEEDLSEEEKRKQQEREHTLRQLRLVENLARRLPWIVLAISILAFVAIFLEILFTR